MFEAVAADAPLRDDAGELPAADHVQVRLLAECLCRLEDVSRSLIELEGRLRREAADHLRELGMTPASRAKLGLDVARGFDLAKHWQEGDE